MLTISIKKNKLGFNLFILLKHSRQDTVLVVKLYSKNIIIRN